MSYSNQLYQFGIPAHLHAYPQGERYYIPAKGSEFIFLHPPPNSLVVEAATEQSRQQHPHSTLTDKEYKCLNLLGHKVFTSASLQFCISNYQALLAKYDFLNYGRLEDFIEKLRWQDRGRFQSILEEGKLVARTVLQSVVDPMDTLSCSMAIDVVMLRES